MEVGYQKRCFRDYEKRVHQAYFLDGLLVSRQPRGKPRHFCLPHATELTSRKKGRRMERNSIRLTLHAHEDHQFPEEGYHHNSLSYIEEWKKKLNSTDYSSASFEFCVTVKFLKIELSTELFLEVERILLAIVSTKIALNTPFLTRIRSIPPLLVDCHNVLLKMTTLSV